MSAIQEKLKKMEIFFDQEEFVVIDNGTGFIKAGFSGQDLPRLIIPTVMGEHTEQIDPQMMNAQNAGADIQEEKKTYAFGNAALQSKDTHDLKWPIKRGIIEDWDAMELMWGHIFDELNLETKNVNVLMTDSPFDTKEKPKDKSRAIMAEILFEHFKVKSLAVMNTAALSMYSTGKVSGLIVESGEGLSYTVPIFEGYALPHA
jgi:actin